MIQTHDKPLDRDRSRPYPLRYAIKVGAFSIDDIDKEHGLADALVLHSIIRTRGGGIDVMTMSRDGAHAANLRLNEMVLVWDLFAHAIVGLAGKTDGDPLDPEFELLLRETHEHTKAIVLARRAEREEGGP